MTGDIIVFGGLLLDRYFQVDRWPERSGDGFFTDEQTFVGGCAVNMAVTAANLGADVHVVSAIGDDSTGSLIMDYMHRNGLSDKYLYPAKGRTGSCLVFSEPDGERTFLTGKGVEGEFPQELMDMICKEGCAAAAVTGYYLLNPDAGRVLECLKELKKQGTAVLFDPSPLAGDIRSEYLSDIMKLADVITPNRSELDMLGGEGVIAELTAQGKTVIYKKGSSGGRVFTPDCDFEYEALKCNAVDTTGAGDSFSGAIAAAMAARMPVREAVDLAVRCSARTVEVYGPHGFWKL